MRQQSRFKEGWIPHHHLEMILPQLDIQLEFVLNFSVIIFNDDSYIKHIFSIPCVAIPGMLVCYLPI